MFGVAGKFLKKPTFLVELTPPFTSECHLYSSGSTPISSRDFVDPRTSEDSLCLFYVSPLI